jgi:hypothetical protein
MPNCDYFAIDDDFDLVLGFIFIHPDWTLWELASRPDTSTRSFRSIAEVRNAFQLGEAATYLLLHSPEMRGEVLYRRIEFRPGAVTGATFRYATEGWGLIQFYFGSLKATGALTASHTNHFTQKGANAKAYPGSSLGDPGHWDWAAVAKISGRLVRFIKKNSIGKFGSCPILPNANKAQTDGRVRLAHGVP